MNVLFLSFYFEPDLSAGSFRNTALLEQLQAILPDDSHIDVITTLPNRYASFSAEAPAEEKRGNALIHRVQLPAHKSGMLDQSRAFIDYARAAHSITRGQSYDLVYASSSRLMTAVLGARLAKRAKAPLYLDIRDIFVDTIKDVLSPKIVWALKPVFSTFERYAIGRATRVNLVSGGFRAYFEARYPGRTFSYYTNGIDAAFLDAAPSAPSTDQPESRRAVILYAGNLGEGQGLHRILPDLATALADKAAFRIFGDGGRKPALENALAEKGVTNVSIHAPVVREQLIAEYQAADVLFLHLNDYDAFRKVLPSKLFEYGALGKPVLAGVAGYAAEFVQSELQNAAVFQPCDAEAGARAFDALELTTQPRTEFIQKYARSAIMEKMAGEVADSANTSHN